MTALDVMAQLDELRVLVTALDVRLDALAEDVREHVGDHGEWCQALSESIGGAAQLLAAFERFQRPENITPRYVEASENGQSRGAP